MRPLIQIQKRFRLFLLSLILGTAALSLIGVSLYFSDMYSFNRRQTEKFLSKGIDRTGVLTITQSPTKEANETMYQMMCNVEGISALGGMSQGGSNLECLSSLRSIQGNKDYLEMIVAQSGTFNLSKHSLAKGKSADQLGESNSNTFLLYLGSDYSSVPIGTVYEGKENGVVFRYKVAGILSKGSRWIEEDVMKSDAFMVMTPLYSLDDKVIMIDNQSLDLNLMYSIDKKADFQRVNDQLAAIAKQCGASIKTKELSDVFWSREREDEVITRYANRISKMVLIITVMLMVCIQLIITLQSQREYGIFYANGYSRRQVLIICALENLIKVVAALILAILIDYGLVQMTFGMLPKLQLHHYLHVYSSMTLYEMVGVGCLIWIITSILPILLLRKANPIALIKGDAL